MFSFNLLFIFLTVFFLFVCSYTDLKTRTISNKFIFFFLIFSFLLKIIQSVFELNIFVLLVVFFSFIITFIVCYVFWELGIIAGGDLKILLVISILFPQTTILSKTIYVFPIVLLLFGFLVLAPYILMYSTISLFSKSKRHLFKEIITINQIKNIFLTIFLLFFITSFLNIFEFYLSFYILFFLSFLLVVFFSKFLKVFKKTTICFLSFFYLLLVIYSLYFEIMIFNGFSLLFLTLTIFLITITTSLIKIITKEILITKKKISSLKEGDVPAYNYYYINNKLKIKKPSFLKTIKLMVENKYYKNLKIDSNKAGGLNKQDITFLKRMYKYNLLEKDIYVKKTLPFTPTLLISYIILILL
jgi:Flp pilus assembly protein protease CpaA